MADRILQAFRSNRELQSFVLSEVRATGRKLGEGSYSSVEELKVKGLVCAGKRLHKALVELGNAGVEKIVSRFLEECKVTTEGVGVCRTGKGEGKPYKAKRDYSDRVMVALAQ